MQTVDTVHLNTCCNVGLVSVKIKKNCKKKVKSFAFDVELNKFVGLRPYVQRLRSFE